MFRRLKAWFRALQPKAIAKWIGGLLSAAITILVLAFVIRWCFGGSSSSPAKPDAKSAASTVTHTSSSTTTRTSKPSLGAKALKKYDADTRRSKSVVVKKAEGDAALEAIDGVKAEDAADKAASFEESRLQMAERAVKATRDELAAAEKEKARIEGQIKGLKRRVGKTTLGLAIDKGRRHPNNTKLKQIEDAEQSIVDDNAEADKKQTQVDALSVQIEKLQAVLENPETIVRRYTDAAGKTVIETK